MLYGGGAITFQSFNWLVGHPLAVNLHSCNVLPLVGQEDLVTNVDVLRGSVQDNWQTKQ